MDKLIKLLNEYGEIRKYNNVGIIEWIEHTKGNLYWRYWENTWSYMVVISKEYGFIKWLVDNDKIDYDKCGLDIKDYLSYSKRYDKGIVMAENYDNDTFVVREFYSPYEQLLMLLSIQDNPIEDLISYLK